MRHEHKKNVFNLMPMWLYANKITNSQLCVRAAEIFLYCKLIKYFDSLLKYTIRHILSYDEPSKDHQ